mgnify:CR=1 FL=1
MYEFELRARIVNVDLFLEKLSLLGCQLGDAVTQKDLIYTHNHALPILRIRQENSFNVLTVKTLQKNRNTAIEYEVIFDNYNNMKEIIKQFHFNEPIKLNKVRRKTVYNEFSITFDLVEKLGYFAEIETLKNDNIDETIVYNAIKKLLFALGVEEDHITDKKYYELLIEKRK